MMGRKPQQDVVGNQLNSRIEALMLGFCDGAPLVQGAP
jgi:hypothetical protein